MVENLAVTVLKAAQEFATPPSRSVPMGRDTAAQPPVNMC